jgi:hypothetical protein
VLGALLRRLVTGDAAAAARNARRPLERDAWSLAVTEARLTALADLPRIEDGCRHGQSG